MAGGGWVVRRPACETVARALLVAVLLADDFTDPEHERLIYLAAGGLVLLGVVLAVVTVMWWRGTKGEHAALAPLEVMGDRSFDPADPRRADPPAGERAHRSEGDVEPAAGRRRSGRPRRGAAVVPARLRRPARRPGRHDRSCSGRRCRGSRPSCLGRLSRLSRPAVSTGQVGESEAAPVGPEVVEPTTDVETPAAESDAGQPDAPGGAEPDAWAAASAIDAVHDSDGADDVDGADEIDDVEGIHDDVDSSVVVYDADADDARGAEIPADVPVPVAAQAAESLDGKAPDAVADAHHANGRGGAASIRCCPGSRSTADPSSAVRCGDGRVPRCRSDAGPLPRACRLGEAPQPAARRRRGAAPVPRAGPARTSWTSPSSATPRLTLEDGILVLRVDLRPEPISRADTRSRCRVEPVPLACSPQCTRTWLSW